MADNKSYTVLLWLVSLLILLVLGIYTYGYLAVAPYVGFQISSTGGTIREVSMQAGSGPALQIEDVIERIDGQDWRDYESDRGRAYFMEYAPGDVMHLQVRRGGRLMELAWVVPEQAAAARAERRLMNYWWMAYVFWVFGLLTFLQVRPRDQRWLLLVVLYYLLAVWLMTGSISYTRIFGCTLLMRAITWLLVPVALHFHWLFPEPLGAPRPRLKWTGYLLASGLELAEILQLLPPRSFIFGALLFGFGSGILLVAHAVLQKTARRELSLLALVIGLLAFLIIGFMVLGQIPGYDRVSGGGLLFAPLFPLAYFLVAVRHGVGGLGWRANLAVNALAFGLVLVALALLLMIPVLEFSHTTAARLMIGLMLLPLTGLLSALHYPRFQHWFESRFLNVPLPAEALAAAYAGRLSANPDLGSLTAMLDDQVFPSLLVRQAALLRLADFDEDSRPRRVQSFYSLGITPAQIPDGDGLRRLLAGERPSGERPCNWVRMTLPLVYGEEIIGACLLGRRDPDDQYGPAEGKLLRTLMHQTALALVNFDQSALLGALHRDSIQFRDQERTRLARDLHDEVLPQMALLTHHVGESQAFEQAYQAAVARVRQVINGLSPATLEQFGLHTALEELLGDLDERIHGAGKDTPRLVFSLSPEKLRYPGEVELHLFRIVQQACLNALKHAQACNLAIRGDLQVGQIELAVEDDGIGFDLSQGLDAASLVENRHYGLLTMCERAALVGAVLRIDAIPGKGTRVNVGWRAGAGDS